VRIWDVKTAKQRHHLEGPKSPVYALDWSKDGQWIAFAGQEPVIWLWNAKTRQPPISKPVQSRLNALSFHTQENLMALAGADHTVKLMNLEGTQLKVLTGATAEMNDVKFTPDGNIIVAASDDGTVRTWRTSTGQAFWRATAMVGNPPELLTHRGWWDLDTDQPVQKKRAKRAWATHLSTDATSSVVSHDEAVLCARNSEGTVTVWDMPRDKVVATVKGVRKMVATPHGCLVRHGEHVSLCTRSAPPKQLNISAPARVLGAGIGTLLVATKDTLFRFNTAGELKSNSPLSKDVTALSWMNHSELGPRVMAGYRDGAIQLQPANPKSSHSILSLQQVPSSPVISIIEGPPGTVVAGFQDGTVGLWALGDGILVRTQRLHGKIRYMTLRNQTIYAVTDLGDYLRWPVESFYREPCTVIRNMWNEVPVVWKSGRATRQTPPVNHPCNQTAVP